MRKARPAAWGRNRPANEAGRPGSAVVQRLVEQLAAGHEVGNHSFSHPNLAAVGHERAVLELNTTQRAIESILGRSTILFRPPYNADAEPVSAEEVAPILLASELGYVTVGERVDPQDWNLARPGPGGVFPASLAAKCEYETLSTTSLMVECW